MKLHGNKFATSFMYTPIKSSNELFYGSCPLIYLEDSNSSNFIELGYTGCRLDLGTRFIFHVMPGLNDFELIPNPVLTYMPSSYISGIDGLDDVPVLSGSVYSWTTDGNYGRVYQAFGFSTAWCLGKYNKSIWFGEDDSFIMEFIFKPTLSFNFYELINIGFDSTYKSGIKLEKNTLFGFKLSYGDGSNVYTIEDTNLLTGVEYIHLGVIKSKKDNSIKLYFNGEEIGSNTLTNLYQAPLYSGLLSSPVFLKDFDGNFSFCKIGVGEYNKSDFSHFLYTKSSNGNSNIVPAFFKADNPNSFYFDYRVGGTVKNIDIFNHRAQLLKNYAVEIDSNFNNPDKVSYEDLDGTPLPHIYYNNRHFVKIPIIPASGVVTIRAIYNENIDDIVHNPKEICLFYDEFENSNFYIEDENWDVIKSNNADLINYTYLDYTGAYSSGLSLSFGRDLSYISGEIFSYVLNDRNYQIPEEGYRILFSNRRTSTEIPTVSGIMGITIEHDNSNQPSECINIVLGNTGGAASFGGAAVGGDSTNFHAYNNWTSTSNITNSGINFQHYKITVNNNRNCIIKNYDLDLIENYGDVGTLISGNSINGGVGLFFADLAPPILGVNTITWQIKDFYVLPYVNNEPTVRVNNETYTITSSVKLYRNGELQF